MKSPCNAGSVRRTRRHVTMPDPLERVKGMANQSLPESTDCAANQLGSPIGHSA